MSAARKYPAHRFIDNSEHLSRPFASKTSQALCRAVVECMSIPAATIEI